MGLKTCAIAQKCFWWCVQWNKIVHVFQMRKSWVFHKNWYVLFKTTKFCIILRNILLFFFVTTSKPQKLSSKPNSFWELGHRCQSSTTICSSGEHAWWWLWWSYVNNYRWSCHNKHCCGQWCYTLYQSRLGGKRAEYFSRKGEVCYTSITVNDRGTGKTLRF